jgi:hypothetical protein
MSYDIAEIVIQQMKPHTIAQFFTCVLRDDEVNRDKAKKKKEDITKIQTSNNTVQRRIKDFIIQQRIMMQMN